MAITRAIFTGRREHSGMRRGDITRVDNTSAQSVVNPVAISDKELSGAESFTIKAYEVCTICGARFGIGYFTIRDIEDKNAVESENWPMQLIELLAKDHRQGRKHKPLMDIDV